MRSNANAKTRECVVKDLLHPGEVVMALVVKRDSAGTAVRVRLQTGEHFGEPRDAGQFEMLAERPVGEAPAKFAAQFSELNFP